MSMDSHRSTSWWRMRSGIALLGFAAIAGFFLLSEHRAHALQWLPWVILLACPLLHVFMHGGHDHGKGRQSDE